MASAPSVPTAPARADLPLPAGAIRWLARDGFNGALAWSPDGRTIAAGGHDGTVKLWDAATGTEARTIKNAAGVLCVTFSSDSKLVAYGDEHASAHIRDAATGREIRVLQAPPTASILGLAFSPDGRLLVGAPRGYKGGTGDERAPLIVWDVATGRELRRMYGHWQYAFSAAFAPDGRSLISSGYDDNSLRLWDMATGKETRRFSGHTLNVPCVAFSPDGRVIASCSEDRTIRLWDPATGKVVRTLPLQRREVYGVAFSPDGRLLASASQDQTVRLWDIATGRQIGGARWAGRPAVVGRVLAGWPADRNRPRWTAASYVWAVPR